MDRHPGYRRLLVRRIVLGVGVVVAAAVVGLVVWSDADGGESGGAGSGDARSVAVAVDETFEIAQTAADHRIVYRLTSPEGDTETDRFTVRGPFESRLETALGAPPGGETVSVQVGTIDRLAIGGVDEPAVVARVPGLAPSAIRITPIIDRAVEAGLLEVREQRVVAERRCQVYRSGTTLASGPLVPITDAEFADSCIDGDGLLLEEALFLEGDPVFRRTAVEVELDAAIDEGDFVVGEPTAPVDQGGGATTPADPDSAPIGPFLELPAEAVPAGFSLLERYSVIPPQPDRFSDPLQRDGIIAGVADVYVNGDGEFFVIYQGGSLGRVEAFPVATDAPAVEVAGVGSGRLLLSATGTEVRVPLAGGRFLHVTGPLDPDVLVDVGASLVEIEGEGLELLGG